MNEREPTLRELTSAHDSPEVPSRGDSALEAWYREMLSKRPSELTVGELARACRQNIFVEHVLPLAVEALGQNILAGDMYDGELLCAVACLSHDAWARQPGLIAPCLSALDQPVECDDRDVRISADLLRRRLQGKGQ